MSQPLRADFNVLVCRAVVEGGVRPTKADGGESAYQYCGAYRLYPVENVDPIVAVQYFERQDDLEAMRAAAIDVGGLNLERAADVAAVFGPGWDWYVAPADSESRPRAVVVGPEDRMLVQVYSDNPSTPACQILLRYVNRR